MPEYEGFDHPTSMWKGQGRDRVGIGFDCVNNGYCYLTYRAENYCEQLGFDREQIEWLIETGLPSLLKDIDQSSDDAQAQADRRQEITSTTG